MSQEIQWIPLSENPDQAQLRVIENGNTSLRWHPSQWERYLELSNQLLSLASELHVERLEITKSTSEKQPDYPASDEVISQSLATNNKPNRSLADHSGSTHVVITLAGDKINDGVTAWRKTHPESALHLEDVQASFNDQALSEELLIIAKEQLLATLKTETTVLGIMTFLAVLLSSLLMTGMVNSDIVEPTLPSIAKTGLELAFVLYTVEVIFCYLYFGMIAGTETAHEIKQKVRSGDDQERTLLTFIYAFTQHLGRHLHEAKIFPDVERVRTPLFATLRLALRNEGTPLFIRAKQTTKK